MSDRIRTALEIIIEYPHSNWEKLSAEFRKADLFGGKSKQMFYKFIAELRDAGYPVQVDDYKHWDPKYSLAVTDSEIHSWIDRSMIHRGFGTSWRRYFSQASNSEDRAVFTLLMNVMKNATFEVMRRNVDELLKR